MKHSSWLKEALHCRFILRNGVRIVWVCWDICRCRGKGCSMQGTGCTCDVVHSRTFLFPQTHKRTEHSRTTDQIDIQSCLPPIWEASQKDCKKTGHLTRLQEEGTLDQVLVDAYS
eukprot:1742894-Amphidinium_carterae.1